MIYRTRQEIESAAIYYSSLPYGGYKEQLYYRKAWIIKPNASDLLIL